MWRVVGRSSKLEIHREEVHCSWQEHLKTIIGVLVSVSILNPSGV
jgi:hypothetical protein